MDRVFDVVWSSSLGFLFAWILVGGIGWGLMIIAVSAWATLAPACPEGEGEGGA